MYKTGPETYKLYTSADVGKELQQRLCSGIRRLIGKEMTTRNCPVTHIGQPIRPGRRHIQRLRHRPVRPEQHQRS